MVRELVCRRGSSCPHLRTGKCIYNHVPDGGPPALCKWYAARCCKFGDRCFRRHKVVPSAEAEDFLSACSEQPSEQDLACMPCTAPTPELPAEGGAEMEVVGEKAQGAVQEAQGQVMEKQEGIVTEVMGMELRGLEERLARAVEGVAKWKERTQKLKVLLKEKEEEMGLWAEQKPEVVSVGVQSQRVRYKSVAVGGDEGGHTLEPKPPEAGMSTSMVLVEEEGRKRQAEREGDGGGKKQVVAPTPPDQVLQQQYMQRLAQMVMDRQNQSRSLALVGSDGGRRNAWSQGVYNVDDYTPHSDGEHEYGVYSD